MNNVAKPWQNRLHNPVPDLTQGTPYIISGITGHVRIDQNGERDADYSVLDLDPITGKFEVVAHYYGMNRKYTAVANKRIHWPGGKEGPPPDVPPCGFMGNDPSCQDTG